MTIRQSGKWPNYFKNIEIQRPKFKIFFIASLTTSSVLLTVILFGQVLPLLFDTLPTTHYLTSIAIGLFIIFLISCVVQNKLFKKLLLLIISCYFGFTWSSLNYLEHQANIIAPSLEGQTIKINGVITNLPTSNASKTSFVLRVAKIFDDPSELNVSQVNTTEITGLDLKRTEQKAGQTEKALHGKLVRLTCYYCSQHFNIGQSWQFKVRLKRPHRYASWGAFDYEKYLFRQQIIANGYIRDVKQSQLLSQERNNFVTRLRTQLRDYLRAELPAGPGAHVLLALTVGDKSEMPPDQRQSLQKLGLSHLVAISGLHIGIVFWFSGWLFGLLLQAYPSLYLWQPKQIIVLFPALVMAICYAALAGFAISTQRALIMLVIYSVCRLLRLDVGLLRVLLITAVVVLLYDPFSVLDAGFWLSFNAVLIIAIINARSAVSLWFLQPILWFGMLPITVLLFSQASIVSPLVNLVMVPIFSLFIIPAALLSVLAWTSYPPLASWLFNQLASLLDWLSGYLQYLANTENIMVSLAQPALLSWCLYGLLLMSCSYKTKTYVRFLILAAMLVSLIFNKPYRALEEGEYRLTLLDVGQGLSLLIETQNQTLLYDTGPAYSSGASAAKSVVLPYLRHRQIAQIDTLIISHADNDHIGGLPQVLAEYAPETILTSRPDKVVGGSPCSTGQAWQDSQVTFTILSPDSQTPTGSNNHSCVLKIEGPYGSLLITGDIEASVERYLLTKQLDLAADIMLVPHQGSKTSSTPAFINAVNPKVALIAAGYRNHYGHPHHKVTERYYERNIDLLSTITSGSIMIDSSQRGWNFEAFREAESGFWSIKK